MDRFRRVVGNTGAGGNRRLNPNRFSANGSRDLLFAIYTAGFGK